MSLSAVKKPKVIGVKATLSLALGLSEVIE
jgi:hypothetical protein